jgi:DNA-binding phage protein
MGAPERDRVGSGTPTKGEDLRRVRVELARSLRSRLDEIEAAVMIRVFVVAELSTDDPEYLTGLRAAVSAAVDHGLTALECEHDRFPTIPSALLAQARLAARMDVPLEAVLRRYFAGYTLLLDFVIAEARRNEGLEGVVLQALLRDQSLVHERVIATVSEEYAREPRFRAGSGAERRAGVVKRLLAGKPLDPSSLGYEFESHHHAVIVRGHEGAALIRRLGTAHERRQLTVTGGPGLIWGWLGSGEPLDTSALAAQATRLADGGTTVAVGEPAAGLAGWRLTHRQARAAMAVAMRRGDRVVRYADVQLLASMLQDELLARSLNAIYLEPLAEERDGGEAVRCALRAYFRAGRNVSSAAAALGVNRQTVAKRLRVVEERLGDALVNRAADLEAALRLEEVRSGPDPRRASA